METITPFAITWQICNWSTNPPHLPSWLTGTIIQSRGVSISFEELKIWQAFVLLMPFFLLKQMFSFLPFFHFFVSFLSLSPSFSLLSFFFFPSKSQARILYIPGSLGCVCVWGRSLRRGARQLLGLLRAQGSHFHSLILTSWFRNQDGRSIARDDLSCLWTLKRCGTHTQWNTTQQ